MRANAIDLGATLGLGCGLGFGLFLFKSSVDDCKVAELRKTSFLQGTSLLTGFIQEGL
jgi:hypothetical protein